MISGVKDKSFENHVDKLCLLCLEDINFSNKIEAIDKDYKFSELHENDREFIKTAISNELKFSINAQYEDMIVFRKTGLKLDNSDSQIVHKILKFIEHNYSNVDSRAISIYRLLKDKLRPKTEFRMRYAYWEDCVKYRGFDSQQFSEGILEHITTNIEPDLGKLIESQLKDNGVSSVKITKILRKISSYYLFKICVKSASVQTELDNFLENIKSELPLNVEDETTYQSAIDFFDKKANEIAFLSQYNKLQAVAIYEVFRMVLEDD